MVATGRPADTAAQAPPDLTRRAVEAVRQMIARHQLSPGEQIRQVELASRLELSRSPLREALRTLETEGLVVHEPNRGYFVARLRADELRQIYRMRELLETDVLRSLRRPTKREISELRGANAAVAAAMDAGSVAPILAANRSFHFLLFDLSPLQLILREIGRLWHISEAYRAAYLWQPERRVQIVGEHAAMIEALEADDLDSLVRIADAHRSVAEASVVSLLASEDDD